MLYTYGLACVCTSAHASAHTHTHTLKVKLTQIVKLVKQYSVDNIQYGSIKYFRPFKLSLESRGAV